MEKYSKMSLEELIEILKVWNIAMGNTNMVAMLEGEKSVEEYIEHVALNDQKYLEETTEKLEKEKKVERPSENLIGHYETVIAGINARQERLSLYRVLRKESS
jgi:predicted RNA-binding protein with EMAP domain